MLCVGSGRSRRCVWNNDEFELTRLSNRGGIGSLCHGVREGPLVSASWQAANRKAAIAGLQALPVDDFLTVAIAEPREYEADWVSVGKRGVKNGAASW